MTADPVLVLVVVVALAFAFGNGFRDTFDLVSTAVSTGAAPPGPAVVAAALLNFAGAFVSVAVVATVAAEVVDAAAITPGVVLAGLLGAIGWNLATLRLGLPANSSHALIGGLLGATVAAAGTDAVIGHGVLDDVLVPALLAPVAAMLLGVVGIFLVYRAVARRRPGPVTRGFRLGQVASGGLLAFGHGANDAQKAMGAIVLALVADGSLDAGADPPFWVVAGAAAAIACGTYAGGLRTARAARSRFIKIDAAQAFCAQGAGAATVLTATFLGFPISSVHAINGGVLGAGAARRISAARWGVASNILAAWLLTLPAAAALGAAGFGVASLFGAGP